MAGTSALVTVMFTTGAELGDDPAALPPARPAVAISRSAGSTVDGHRSQARFVVDRVVGRRRITSCGSPVGVRVQLSFPAHPPSVSEHGERVRSGMLRGSGTLPAGRVFTALWEACARLGGGTETHRS